MSTKRSHTKSRLGCRTCKVRKIKCDERKPVCSNCSKRFPNLTQCDFDNFLNDRGNATPATVVQAPTPTSTAAASPPNTSIQPSSSTPVSIQLPEKPRTYDARLLELRLFHQWTSSTSKTYTEYLQHSVLNSWIEQLPTWAFTHEFLLDFILAFSALHLWREDPETNAEMKSAYLYYVTEAGLKHRNELCSVNKANAVPLFVAAMMTNLQGKMYSFLRGPNEPYELPLQGLLLTNGIVATYRAVEPFIPPEDLERVGNIGPMLYQHGIDLKELSFLPREAKQDIQMLLHVIGEQSDASTGVENTQEILRETLAKVGAIQFGWASHEPETWTMRRINVFTGTLPAGFIELLRKKNSLAMAILARYFLQLKGRQEWFLKGAAEAEIEGIAGLVRSEMQWVVGYPIKEIRK